MTMAAISAPSDVLIHAVRDPGMLLEHSISQSADSLANFSALPSTSCAVWSRVVIVSGTSSFFDNKHCRCRFYA